MATTVPPGGTGGAWANTNGADVRQQIRQAAGLNPYPHTTAVTFEIHFFLLLQMSKPSMGLRKGRRTIGLLLGRLRNGSNAQRVNSCSTSQSSNNRFKERGLGGPIGQALCVRCIRDAAVRRPGVTSRNLNQTHSSLDETSRISCGPPERLGFTPFETRPRASQMRRREI